MIPIELALESIRIDPGNRQAYEVLAILPRSGRAAKNAVEKGLSDMVEQFPGDPYPYLELARLYYERSAFRKAEKVLQAALEQAPHDPKVVEKNALACLIAAEKNLDRDKLHLVEKDVDRAGDFDAKKLAPFILEKQILLRLRQGETPEDFLDEILAAPPPLDQLRALSVLLMDIGKRGFDLKGKDARKLELTLNRRLADHKRLTSEEISRLLMPLDRSLRQIYPSVQAAPTVLSRKPDILKGLTDADAIDLYDKILSPETLKPIQKDLKKRTPKAKKDHQILLSFIQEVLGQIKKENFRSKNLIKWQAEASGPLSESLRSLSRRLAPHAPEPLKQALEMFQFEILDHPPFPFGGGLDGFFDIFEDPLFDDDDDDGLFEDDGGAMLPGFLDPDEIGQLDRLVKDLERMRKMGMPQNAIPLDLIQEMLDEVEDMVDGMGMRHLPDQLILGMRELIESTGHFRKAMKLMGRFMELTGGKPRLSREARTLLYGKKKGG
jgi:tetratricopeptide (TPR) repeat protein